MPIIKKKLYKKKIENPFYNQNKQKIIISNLLILVRKQCIFDSIFYY